MTSKKLSMQYLKWGDSMRCILISEQDKELFELSEKALQKSFRVLSLHKDTDIAEYFSEYNIDVILLTVSVTDTSGFLTHEVIKEAPEMNGVPVLYLSKQYDHKLEHKALSKGAADFIAMPVSPELLHHRVNDCQELAYLRTQRPYLENYQDAISTSFAELVDFRDPTTGGHLKKTTKYFGILLQEAIASDAYDDIISQEEVRDLLRSAILHDIGKIGIEDDILRKESSLDYNEFEDMKTHTILGKQAFERIIEETGGSKWLYLAKDMAYCHHERWDGLGYPQGLKGEDIPLYARMIMIADVYDALTSDRSYKKAFTHSKAMKIIEEGKGSLFDPGLVDILIKADKKFKAMLLENTEAHL